MDNRSRVRKHHSARERRRQQRERTRVGRRGASRTAVEASNQSGSPSELVVDEKMTRTRRKRRRWTVNRSPHGNKTAREQLGREQWEMRRLYSVNSDSAGVCARAREGENESGHERSRKSTKHQSQAKLTLDRTWRKVRTQGNRVIKQTVWSQTDISESTSQVKKSSH